jgi:hypothetical protein
MLRKSIHEILNNLSRTYKTSPKDGLYPPQINLRKDQSDKELVAQLKLFLNYIERPYNSHNSKKN